MAGWLDNVTFRTGLPIRETTDRQNPFPLFTLKRVVSYWRWPKAFYAKAVLKTRLVNNLGVVEPLVPECIP